MKPLIRRAAVFDATGEYRYRLSRDWDEGAPIAGRVCFVMLNPSTADAERDDPTIRRCIGFAQAWGYGGLDVVNLWAFRTPTPALLRRASDPTGPDNEVYLAEAVAQAACVVAAWGTHGAWRGRGAEVLPRLGPNAVCLGRTRGGEPRHPLYIKGDAVREALCA